MKWERAREKEGKTGICWVAVLFDNAGPLPRCWRVEEM
jgi:hypothetical protein